MDLNTRRCLRLLSLATVLLAHFVAGCSVAPSSPTAYPLPATSTPSPPSTSVPSTVTPTPDLLKTRLFGIPLTYTAQATDVVWPTRTAAPTGTSTPVPSPTAPQIDMPGVNFNPDGDVPTSSTPIREDNLTQLVQIAQWGKGSIRRIISSPDGQTLLAGSPFGIAVYSLDDFQKPARWLPFDAPTYFHVMLVSTDGTLVLLRWPQPYPSEKTETRVFNLVTGSFQPEDKNTEWVISQSDQIGGYSGLTVTSPDNKLWFEGQLSYLEENWNIETFEGFVYDNQTGEQRFRLKEESLYVNFEDYHKPEGCDLDSFSPCGNVYDPNLMAPYRAAFSDTGKRLAVLYRPPNLSNSNQFSLLRIYSTQDGSVMDIFGSFDQPVEDFAFQPGSDRLSIAFVSGSIQTWDLAARKLLHQTWDFRPIRNHLSLFRVIGGTWWSNILISLKCSTPVMGRIAGRYEASAFALSPHENLLALGNEQGGIQVEDLDQQKTISRMVGHTAVIYALAFSPDGQTLTSSSEDCFIRSWDVHTGTFQHFFEKAEVDVVNEGYSMSRIFVYYMKFVPGSDQLVGFGSWGTAASWNIHSGAKEYTVISQPLEFYNGMQTINPHFPQSFWVVPEESRFYVNEVAYDLENGEAIGGYTPPENLPEGCGSEGPQSAGGENPLYTRDMGSWKGRSVCLARQITGCCIEFRFFLSKMTRVTGTLNRSFFLPMEPGCILSVGITRFSFIKFSHKHETAVDQGKVSAINPRGA